MKQDMIVILDLGSHENTVLARAIRALGVYSEIYPHDITVEELKALPNVKGIIINGGPNNVIDGVTIDVNPGIYSIGIPVMAAGHDKALCEVKLNEFSSDMEAIKESVKTFVFDTCKAEANWNMTNFVNDQIELVRRQVGDRKGLLALSGGVDSSVVAALLLKAIGDKLVCVHVNHGLMRKGESENVVEVFKNQLNANLIYKDVTDRFLDKLAGVADPEEKRKIIGGEFIRVFEEEARKLDGIDFLAQGTIYPDIVESGTKTAKMVKSHHNVGGLPEDLKFELVEPLRQLFKDEVRACGLELGLPYEMVFRQPFPGPGLGVRCLGAITRDRLEAVREADAILREEFQLAGLDNFWVIFRNMDDDAAVLLMVDSNLQRESILPSERAFAYKMKLEALKNQGARSDLTSSQVGMKLQALDIVGQEAGDSRNQVHRFIRLTNLIPELLDLVDEKKISFNPAVELSYLDEAQQRDFLQAMDETQNAPSLSQAQRMKKLAQEEKFTYEAAFAIMGEAKKDELDKVVIKNDTLKKYFPRSYTPRQMEDVIIKLLEQWQRRQQRQNER